ncbi:MAG: hypothetical protein D3907_01575 [Candidatus Electrothrix sp. AUS3]|nr:hypothetical protein [Candidatus Electrothrix gigas]
MRIEQIILIPTVGLNSAIMSITGQNNGAQRYDRIYQAWKTTMMIGGTMMLLGGIVLFFWSKYLLALFTEDQEVLSIGQLYL